MAKQVKNSEKAMRSRIFLLAMVISITFWNCGDFLHSSRFKGKLERTSPFRCRDYMIRFLSWLLAFVPLIGVSQSFEKTSDNRFMGHLTAYPGFQDKTELMTSARLTFEWWTLLAEPVEIYHIKWQASDHFKFNGTTLYKNQLTKYPDLLKRFDNLRPSHIDFQLKGSANGDCISIKGGQYAVTGKSIYTKHAGGYKKDGKVYQKYCVGESFVYQVEDVKLLPTKAGKVGNGIVPGSPHWNDFLRWGLLDISDYDKIDKKDNKAKELNKDFFKKTKSIEIESIEIIKLEWPEYELKAIMERFAKYEKGEEAPTPKEQVDSALTAMEGLNTYEEDDEWAQPVQDFKMEKVRDDNGKYGYKNEYGQPMIPPRFDDAGDFKEGKAIVRENGKSGIINKQGQYLLKLESGYISQVYQNIVVVSDNGKYGLYSLQGKSISGLKFNRIGEFKNGIADANVLKSSETLEYDPCDDRYLNYYDEGTIDVSGNWVEGPLEYLSITAPYRGPTLTLVVNYETEEEERAADRRAADYQRRKEACLDKRDADLSRIKSSVRARGGRVSD